MSLVKCRKLLNTLRTRSTNKMIAKILHPRLLRGGRDAGGGVMTGGGFIGGGLKSGVGGKLLSMARTLSQYGERSKSHSTRVDTVFFHYFLLDSSGIGG